MTNNNFGLIEASVSIFFVFNALGMVPAFVSLLARYSHKRQIQIIVRELLIALFALLAFTFFGNKILKYLSISTSSIGIAGGILLFIIALNLIFPKNDLPKKSDIPANEPFIIPLAIPGLAGPGTITALMVISAEAGPLNASLAFILAWIPSFLIILACSYIKKILGEKGLIAVERLGGMILALIGIETFTNGVINTIKVNFPTLGL